MMKFTIIIHSVAFLSALIAVPLFALDGNVAAASWAGICMLWIASSFCGEMANRRKGERG